MTIAGIGTSLGVVQQRILIEMEERADAEGLVQISRDQLARLVGSDNATVKWLLRSLRERGLISVAVPAKGGRGKGVPPVWRLEYFVKKG